MSRQFEDFIQRRCAVGEVLVEETAGWGKGQFGQVLVRDLNLTDFLGTIFILTDERGLEILRHFWRIFSLDRKRVADASIFYLKGHKG